MGVPGSEGLFLQSLVLIVACAAASIVFARLGLPPVLGYLVAGVVIGPHGLGVLPYGGGVRFFAEMGVIFLLFMVGLEFSLSKMIEASRIVFGVGGLQVAATTLIIATGAIQLGFDLHSAVILGGVVAMSSTAVVLKELADIGELSAPHGRLVVGILLFQDLAAMLFVILMDGWRAGAQIGVSGTIRHLAIAVLAFSAVAFVSRPLFRHFLASVARLHSTEPMLLTIMAIALGTAFLSYWLGLSPPIGAFLAGMVIGETDFRYQIEDDIRPFRDLLFGVFFVAVGAEVDAKVMLSQPLAVMIWLALFLGKGIFAAVVVRATGSPRPVAIRAGACLAQGSEFGLLLVTMAMRAGILSADVGQPVLVALALSMGLAPLIVKANERIGRLLSGRAFGPRVQAVVGRESADLNHHILLLGCGRVGGTVAAVLDASQIPYLALERNHDNFQRARRQGCRVVLADASRPRLLSAAGLQRARLLVITFDSRRAVHRILYQVRQENPSLATLVSIRDDLEARFFTDMGASVVFPENVAAGLALGDRALMLAGLSEEEAAAIVKRIGAELDVEIRSLLRI